ncbi:MAG: FecR domain-containing protein [Gemmatimonadota bacterium]|nr:FecR domain-containing protein [Gemmatimonadota bacterium]
MPAPLNIDRDALDGLHRGDEQSLERVFRDVAPALTAEANNELNQPASAAHVVENVFIRVWEGRSEWTSPEALETFLHEAVHTAAVRERSRLAALHRFETGAGAKMPASSTSHVDTTDEAWSHIVAALHAPATDRAASAHQRGDATRHAAAEHVAHVGEPRSWVPLAIIGAAILVIVPISIWWMNRASVDAAATNALASPDARFVASRPGQMANVTLEDGSKVSVGAETRMKIPPHFGALVRALQLEGTATFDVAKGNPVPLQVRAGDVLVNATGTTFTVRAYPADSAVTVRVKDGTVTVRAAGADRALTAGQAILIAKDGAMREPAAGALDASLAWTDGKVVIPSRPLRDALPEILRWYGLTIRVPDTALLDRIVTVNAPLESSADAIAAIESSGKLKFGYEGKVMVFKDASAAPAPEPKGKRTH